MKLKLKTVLMLICWMLFGGLAIPGAAWCENTEDEKSVTLDSVTVTANKMEEDIKDVPQSITVINEFVMEEKGIKDISGVVQEIPNMYISPGVHGNALSFRGLNPSMFTNNNPVVLYIDGVPTTDRYAFDASLANVERIEVLRGPQGTLYGKDAIGGVINIVTKTPTNIWQGKVGAEYGRFNTMQGIFNGNGPLVKNKLFLGINGQYQQDDGWIDNIHAGMDSDANRSKDRRISGYLLYTPIERFSARLTLSDDYTKDSWTNGYALPSGTDFDEVDRDDAENVDFDVPTDIEQARFSQSLNLRYAFEPMTLTSTTTHSNFDIEGDYDAEYGDNPMYAGLKQFSYSETDAYTQELRLSSNSQTGIRWVAGVYYDCEDRDQGPYGMQFPNYDPVTYDFLGNYEMNAESETDNTTYAAFGQLIVPFAHRFELTLGGRYQHIDKQIDLDMYYLPVGTTGPAYFSYSGDKEWDVFLPKAALRYGLNDNWNTYLSYSHGYMPGGFNYFATSGTAADNSFDPQQSKNYEVGIKGAMERLQVAASLFYMDIEDIHVYKAQGTGIYYTDNADSAHSQGVELELSYRLTDAIVLTGAFGITEAQYDTYDAGDGISFDGQDIPNTPAYTATAGISYAHPSGVYSRVDLKALGEVYFYDDANKRFVKEDAYTVVDAKIGYQFRNWDLYVYGKNLTDEEYVTDFLSNSNLMMVDFGDPRTFGVGLRYRF